MKSAALEWVTKFYLKYVTATDWTNRYYRYGFDIFSTVVKFILTATTFMCSTSLDWLHAFFFLLRTSNFRLRLECSEFFGDFSLKLFLNCSYSLIFLNSELLVARNNTCKMALRKSVCYRFIQWKHLKLSWNTASANVTSLLITLPLPAPDDQAKF